MTESEFWKKLYMIVCWRDAFPELGGAYDWITPEKYILGNDCVIVGEIGLIGCDLSKCDFELRLKRSYASISEIDWKSALPPSKELDSKIPQPTSEETSWMWLESGKIIIEAPDEISE